MKKIQFSIFLIISIILLNSCGSTRSNQKNTSLDGTWIGKGYQFDADSQWDIKFSSNSLNKTYKIEYPSLGCSGNWNLITTKEHSYEFREVLEVGLNICTTNGRVVLNVIDNKNIEFQYFWPNDETLNAIGRLTKK